MTPRLHDIHCPTLIRVGKQDVFGVDPSLILSCGILGARLEVVPGRGHGLFLEDPEGLNQIVDGVSSQAAVAITDAGPSTHVA